MAFASVMAAKSPAAWWRQDESSGTQMLDSSGNARHGSYPNPPTFGATGLLHDGDGSTANVYSKTVTTYGVVSYNSALLNVPQFSLFVRIKPSTVTGTQAIAARFGTSSGGWDAWSLRLDDANLRLYVNNAEGTYPSVTLGTVAAGVEYSVGFTYDSGVTRVFLDGAYVASLTSTVRSSLANLAIGRSGYGEPFDGTLDEIGYWTRALADADHADLHNATSAPAGPPTAYLLGTAPGVSGSLSATATAQAVDATLTGMAPSVVGSLSGGIPDAVIGTLDGQAPAVFSTFAGSYVAAIVGTDTTYANDGYNYDGVADVDEEPPVAAPPAHIRRVKVRRVHQSMPAPTLVNGRPT